MINSESINRSKKNLSIGIEIGTKKVFEIFKKSMVLLKEKFILMEKQGDYDEINKIRHLMDQNAFETCLLLFSTDLLDIIIDVNPQEKMMRINSRDIDTFENSYEVTQIKYVYDPQMINFHSLKTIVPNITMYPKINIDMLNSILKTIGLNYGSGNLFNKSENEIIVTISLPDVFNNFSFIFFCDVPYSYKSEFIEKFQNKCDSICNKTESSDISMRADYDKMVQEMNKIIQMTDCSAFLTYLALSDKLVNIEDDVYRILFKYIIKPLESYSQEIFNQSFLREFNSEGRSDDLDPNHPNLGIGNTEIFHKNKEPFSEVSINYVSKLLYGIKRGFIRFSMNALPLILQEFLNLAGSKINDDQHYVNSQWSPKKYQPMKDIVQSKGSRTVEYGYEAFISMLKGFYRTNNTQKQITFENAPDDNVERIRRTILFIDNIPLREKIEKYLDFSSFKEFQQPLLKTIYPDENYTERTKTHDGDYNLRAYQVIENNATTLAMNVFVTYCYMSLVTNYLAKLHSLGTDNPYSNQLLYPRLDEDRESKGETEALDVPTIQYLQRTLTHFVKNFKRLIMTIGSDFESIVSIVTMNKKATLPKPQVRKDGTMMEETYQSEYHPSLGLFCRNNLYESLLPINIFDTWNYNFETMSDDLKKIEKYVKNNKSIFSPKVDKTKNLLQLVNMLIPYFKTPIGFIFSSNNTGLLYTNKMKKLKVSDFINPNKRHNMMKFDARNAFINNTVPNTVNKWRSNLDGLNKMDMELSYRKREREEHNKNLMKNNQLTFKFISGIEESNESYSDLFSHSVEFWEEGLRLGTLKKVTSPNKQTKELKSYIHAFEFYSDLFTDYLYEKMK